MKLIVGFNFSLNNNSDGQTIAAGQSATYELDAIPLGNGSVFPSNLTLSCSSTGLAPLSTCSFTPTQVLSGSGNTNVRLNIVTTSASRPTARLGGNSVQLWFDLGFSIAGVVLAFGGLKKPSKPRKRMAPLLILLSVLLSVFVACGGGGDGGGGNGAGHPGTPPGKYTITVNGVVGTITRSAQVELTVQ